MQSGGWLGSGIHGSVKFTLDMAIGETSRIESTDKAHVQTLVEKVQDLNSRLQDVRREQIFQRVSHTAKSCAHEDHKQLLIAVQEREAEFRDQSESTNARVVRWTLIQLAVLGVTCAWQLTHLRAFFVKQKLV